MRSTRQGFSPSCVAQLFFNIRVKTCQEGTTKLRGPKNSFFAVCHFVGNKLTQTCRFLQKNMRKFLWCFAGPENFRGIRKRAHGRHPHEPDRVGGAVARDPPLLHLAHGSQGLHRLLSRGTSTEVFNFSIVVLR